MKYFAILIIIFLSCTDEPTAIPEPNNLIIVSVTFDDYEELEILVATQCPGCFIEFSGEAQIIVLDEFDNRVFETTFSVSTWSCIDSIADGPWFPLSSEDVPPAALYRVFVSIDLEYNNCNGESQASGMHEFRYLL